MTKVMYIEVMKDVEDIDFKLLNKLPKEILIAYSIQFKPLALRVRNYLKKKGVDIKGVKQVLGCSKLKTKFPILLIGEGKFHALGLALQNEISVYIYNGLKLEKIDENEIKRIKARKKGAFLKFLAADKIGVLVSSKPGQNRIKDARALKKKLEKKGKNVYIFTANNFNLAELENFNIGSWVNTACPGLGYDNNNLINIDDINDINY